MANQLQATNSSGNIIAKKCDVTNEAEVLSVFNWVKDKFGHLDVFINNAGVIKSDMLLGTAMASIIGNNMIESIFVLFLEGKTEDFKNIFDVNVISACVCIREAVKLIKANGSFGHVIVINR